MIPDNRAEEGGLIEKRGSRPLRNPRLAARVPVLIDAQVTEAQKARRTRENEGRSDSLRTGPGPNVDHPERPVERSCKEDAGTESPRYFVQSLARGLDVVRAFGSDGHSLALGEIARRTGMSRAAVRRYVLTLRDLGYIEARGTRFELKPRLLELGYSYLSSLPLWKVAEPVLTRLVESVHESCSISVLDLPDIVYVARVPVKRIITPNVSVGTRLPAFATSMGRVMLAALSPAELDRFLRTTDLRPITRFTITDPDELRKVVREAAARGYAVSDQEFELGLRSIGVPIRDRTGATIAALNMSVHATRADARTLVRTHLDHLAEASREITSSLPY